MCAGQQFGHTFSCILFYFYNFYTEDRYWKHEIYKQGICNYSAKKKNCLSPPYWLGCRWPFLLVWWGWASRGSVPSSTKWNFPPHFLQACCSFVWWTSNTHWFQRTARYDSFLSNITVGQWSIYGMALIKQIEAEPWKTKLKLFVASLTQWHSIHKFKIPDETGLRGEVSKIASLCQESKGLALFPI